MKKALTLFSVIAVLFIVLSSNTKKISTFVMTTVTETPDLPSTPYAYSDIPFPDHIFNDNDTIIGYRAGGRLDSLVLILSMMILLLWEGFFFMMKSCLP
ncbi:MAG: hypothetical protein ACI9P5_002641 [Saprospiraceae bacterium]|jgi:hypothetical protein|tara:strand:+ start:1559 stop:1855 length:297 start_codon:yes stop_codon:yes gene_type:complete